MQINSYLSGMRPVVADQVAVHEIPLLVEAIEHGVQGDDFAVRGEMQVKAGGQAQGLRQVYLFPDILQNAFYPPFVYIVMF